MANIPPSRSLDEGVAEFRNYVKVVFSEAPQQDNTITCGHSMNVEVPPDKTLVVAHTIFTSKAQDLDSSQLVHDLLIDDVSKGYETEDIEIYHQLVKLCGAKAADGLAREEFDDLNPNDACEAIARLAKLALTMPTRYMEAVPRRSVKFSEFDAALIAERYADHPTVQQLADMGVRIIKYDGTEQGLQTAAKRFALDYGFSAEAIEGAEASRKPVVEYKTFHVSEGRKNLLKGTLDLYDGYVINEFDHGECADLLCLGDFILGLPIAKTKSNTFVIENKKLKKLATEIAEYYDKAGIHALNIAPLGEVIIDKTGVENSIGHFTHNAKTSKEHKQRVCDAFALVPDVLERDVLVEYGTQVDNDRLRSYLYVAPVTIGQETCIMAVRVRCQQKQAKRFYLHGVALLDDLKQKALEPAAVQRVGLVTDTLTGADPREVFRVVKKALAVKIQKGIHVLERGVLVEYGTQVDNDRLRSYLYVAPVTIGQETCIMAVRVRCQQKQAKRFYLHGVALLDDLKQKSLVPSAIRRVGLGTENRIGDDPREVFRVVKKDLAVKIQKGEITGGYNLCVGKKAKNWKSLPGERKVKSVLDGRMRFEHSAFTRANR